MESASDSVENQWKELKIDIPDEPLLWPECCIYKVPEDLRKLNVEAYTPQLISIGPLHKGNEKLADMEMQKLIYLRKFYERPGMKLEDFVRMLKGDENHIRQCYAQKSKLCSNEYVKMILLDAVFIIELFLRNHEKKDKNGDENKVDYMLAKPWLMNGICYDLLLLENQLPYFVLIKLYNLAFTHKPTFHELACEYFERFIPNYKDDTNKLEQTKVLHFTDLLRHFMSELHREMDTEVQEPEGIKCLYTVTKLHEAGVNFKMIKKKCLTDVIFEKGELMMPQFMVEDSTELVIRNIMALEQCHHPDNAYICNYISLLDFLINTTKDVDLLVEKRIIVNWLGSNEAVANLVNSLCKNIAESNDCYRGISDKLNKFYEEPWHHIKASFWGMYFSDFWRGFSTVAAIVLLFLTVPGTIRNWQAFF